MEKYLPLAEIAELAWEGFIILVVTLRSAPSVIEGS